MNNKVEVIYKPKFHVCSSHIWQWENRVSAGNLVVGMIIRCSCGDYYKLSDRQPKFWNGYWTISWYQARLFWIRTTEKPQNENSQAN